MHIEGVDVGDESQSQATTRTSNTTNNHASVQATHSSAGPSKSSKTEEPDDTEGMAKINLLPCRYLHIIVILSLLNSHAYVSMPS